VSLRLYVIVPVMVVIGVIFIVATLTWMGRLDVQMHWRRAGKAARHKAVGTVIGAGVALIAGAVYIPNMPGSAATLSVTAPVRSEQNAAAIVGCGKIAVHVSGPHTQGESVVLATNQDGELETQVESHVAWNPGLEQWVGQVTFASAWPVDRHTTYSLNAYLMPQQWVSYVRQAVNWGTPLITWWPQAQPPPDISASAGIPIQLVRAPGPDQPGVPCPMHK
jgi:hypothetical protein